MRKGLVKKFWIFMVSLLMIIGNMQSFVFAEDRSKSSVTTQAQVTSIQIKDSSGNWVDLAPRTVIKDGTEVNIVGQYTVSNLENTDEDIDIYVNLEPQNMNIENTDAHEISTDSLGSKWKIDEGQLHLRITSGYADKHQNITGGFNVPGRISIDKTKYNKGDSVEVKIGDKTVSITFDNGEIESSLNASKEAVGNITKGADGKLYQSYKVNLYAQNGDVTLNSVTDILGSKQVLASKVTFTNTSKDNITSSTEYTNFTDIQNITIAEGKTATLEYTVKVDGTEDLTKANLADVETYGNRFKANYTTDENQKKETIRRYQDLVKSAIEILNDKFEDEGACLFAVQIMQNIASLYGQSEFTRTLEIQSEPFQIISIEGIVCLLKKHLDRVWSVQKPNDEIRQDIVQVIRFLYVNNNGLWTQDDLKRCGAQRFKNVYINMEYFDNLSLKNMEFFNVTFDCDNKYNKIIFAGSNEFVNCIFKCDCTSYLMPYGDIILKKCDLR